MSWRRWADRFLEERGNVVLSITIGSNIASLKAQGLLRRANEQVGTSLERLSTGMRINRASDDAAGLSIASRLSSDTKVYGQAIRNVNDTISAVNIAEGTISDLTNILTQYKELAEQAANGTYSSTQRTALDLQAQAIQNEYNRLIASSDFNGLKLLDGSQRFMSTQVGYSTLQVGIGNSIGRVIGNGTFTSGAAQGAGGTRNCLATGDINGDGVTDNVSARVAAGTLTVSVQTGNGDGTFTESNKTTTLYQTVNDIGLADVNGDGQLDIVVLGTRTVNGRARTSSFLNTGSSTFGAAVTTDFAALDGGASFIYPNTLALGDINGDGRADIGFGWDDLVTNLGYNTMLGTGTGAFTYNAGTEVLGNTPTVMSFTDMNGDGKLDLVINDSGGGGITIKIGSGTGTFSAGTTYGASGYGSAAIGDLNGDGINDVAAATGSALHVFFGSSSGALTFNASYSSITSGGLAIADLNGDGAKEIVGITGILNNNGSGTFTSGGTHTAIYSGAAANTFGIGDTNRDGVPDIIGLQSDQLVHAQLQGTTVNNTLERLSVATQASARTTLDSLETYLTRVASEVGTLGSLQSRLQSAVKNLESARVNFQSAFSSISDADVASESANLIRNNILQQTSSSILAQANQQPEIALSLLKNI